MNIRSKLQLVALLPLLVFILLAAVLLNLNRAMELRRAQEERAAKLNRSIAALLTLSYEYERSGSERPASQWHNQHEAMLKQLSEARSLAAAPAERNLLAKLDQGLRDSAGQFADLRRFDGDERHDEMARQLRERMTNNLLLNLYGLAPAADQLQAMTQAELLRAIRRGVWMSALFMSFLIILLPLLLVLLIRTISRPLEQLQLGMQAMSAGELGQRLEITSADELGLLTRNFNEMSENLATVTVSRDTLRAEIAERQKVEQELRDSQEKYRIAADNTERKFMEEGLRQGEQRYRKLFEAASDAIFLLRDGVISDCNGGTLKLFGRSREEIIGQPPWLFSPPVQADGEDSPTRGARLIGGALTGESRPFNWLHTRPDGSEFTAEISLTRIELSSGIVLQAVARDITERRRAEMHIRQLNAELEQRVADRTSDLRGSQQALMNIVEDLGQKSVELAAANAELQGLDRLKSMFVASMSHELRTPLNSIIGFSTVVLEEWLGPLNAEQKAKLAIVLRTGKHLLTLINDVIDVSKIESGKLESRIETFELREVVAEALELLRKDGEEKGLTFRDATTTLTLHSDRRRFFQCLVNLLGNAVKFSNQGEVAVVSGLVPGIGGGPDRLRISVRDGGIGITEAELPKLFTAFTRIQSELSPTVKGTGLGLYLVKKITTEILRGEVGVESTLGQGSIFSLTVPLRIEERGSPPLF